MSLVIHYWIEDVQDSQGVSTSEMACFVSRGALNSAHSRVSFYFFMFVPVCDTSKAVRMVEL